MFRYVVLSFEDFGISDIHDFFLGPLGHFIWHQRRFIEENFPIWTFFDTNKMENRTPKRKIRFSIIGLWHSAAQIV